MSSVSPSLSQDAAQLDAAPFAAEHPHVAFIKQRLPAWYLAASTALRQALHTSLMQAQTSRQRVESVRSQLLSAQTFAEPLLEQAFFERFKLRLDMNAYQLAIWRYDSAWQANPLQQTLLQAALQNFASSHRSRFDPHSALLKVDGLRYWLINSAEHRYGVEYNTRLDVAPEQFADFCHALDLGGKYQEHLNSVFKPATAPGQPPDSAEQAVAAAFMASERDSVEVLAHIAMMKNDIGRPAYQMLLDVLKPAGTPRWDDQAIRYCQLHMLDTYVFAGCLLQGALLIQQNSADPGNGPCVVYMPGEPEHPIKEYPSFKAFAAALTTQLGNRDYQQYFSRFISLGSSAQFFATLEQRLKPEAASGEAASSSPQDNTLDPNADLLLQAQPVDTPPFNVLFKHLLDKTYADSRSIAVPSALADEKARDALLDSLESRGLDMLNAAGFFVPVLGEIAAVVALYQLAHEAFVAYQDWTHGETAEAMQHVLNIGESVAQVLVVHQVLGIAQRIESSLFVESLVEKTSPDAQLRLGKPNVDAYAGKLRLPEFATVNELGLYEVEGKTWLSLEGKYYRVEFDTARSKWCIRHPTDPQMYSPTLEHNGAGAWRHEWESPMGWDEVTAFNRLRVSQTPIAVADIQRILRTTGIDDAVLRQVHVDNLGVPALLKDATQRLSIEAGLQKNIDALVNGDLSGLRTAHLAPWMKLLASSPRWHQSRGLLLMDAQDVMLDSWNVNSQMTLSSHVTESTGSLQLALGQVLDSLPSSEIKVLLGEDLSGRPAQLLSLARHLGEHAHTNGETLFEDFCALKNRSSDPLVTLLQRDFSGLPDVVANEVLGMASDAQRTRMSTAERIPLEIAEHVREYQQQLRVNRANEGFYRRDANHPDTLAAGFGLLSELPGWPEDLSIELHSDGSEGEIIASLGDSQTATTDVVIIKTEAGYQALDAQGELTGETDQRFFSALLQALPARVLEAIGMPAEAGEQPLLVALGDIAVQRRERVAQILRLQAIKPGFKWPQRQPDGRVGYPMSGRLRRLFRRLGLGAARHSNELAVKSLYPTYTDSEVRSFLNGLRAEHQGTAEQLPAFIQQRLFGLATEYRVLRSTLKDWVNTAQAQPALHSARQMAATRIKTCWKRTGSELVSVGGEFLGYLLDLDNLKVGDLPLLTANFDHVAVLKARDMDLTSSQANVMLGHFKQLRSLRLGNNNLQTLPESVGQMAFLQDLLLSNNPLTLNANDLSGLQRLHHLESLDLSFCPLGPVFHVPTISSLRRLYLRACGLESVPEWIWRWPQLVHLDLRQNRISEITEVQLSGLGRPSDSLQMYVYLDGNPLSAATLERARVYSNAHPRNHLLGIANSTAQPASSLPSSSLWLTGIDSAALLPRMKLWADLQSEADSGDFFRVLGNLTLSADFSNSPAMLTQRVWAVIDAAAADTVLRQELFNLAAHPQTCGDGLALVFNDLEIHVRISKISASSVADAKPLAMFKLARGMDRLDQVERIAQLDIARRLAQQHSVDEAEVRLAYRVGLASRLELPDQSSTMLFVNVAGVSERDLELAYNDVVRRERTPEFTQSLIARPFWMDYLEQHHTRSFAPLKETFQQRLALLDNAPEGSLSDQQYLEQVENIALQRVQAINAHAVELSRQQSEALFRLEFPEGVAPEQGITVLS